MIHKLSRDDWREVRLLATPSWLSGLIAVVIGLMISGGVIIAFEVNNSPLQEYLLNLRDTSQPADTSVTQSSSEHNKPSLKDSWPLLVVWSLAGLAVYFIAASIVHSIARAEEVRESLDYVNAKPRTVMTSAAEHLLLRLFATILLIAFMVTFWKQVIPYGVTAAHAAAADITSPEGALYALLSFAIIAVSLHVLTILLRLSLGKARVFSEA